MIVLPPMSSARCNMTSGKNWRVLLGKDDRDQKQQECDGTKERKLRPQLVGRGMVRPLRRQCEADPVNRYSRMLALVFISPGRKKFDAILFA